MAVLLEKCIFTFWCWILVIGRYAIMFRFGTRFLALTVENSKRKWCSYCHANGNSNKSCHQQHLESERINNKKRWCSYHKSGSHLDDECHHQRNSTCNSSADSKSTQYETFIADSTMIDCDKYICSIKVENK